MRLLQIVSQREGRRVAFVEENKLRLVEGHGSIYALAGAAIASAKSLEDTVEKHLSRDVLDYDEVYEGRSPWRILPAIDHPVEPARCLVTGTGLTHRGSAANRQSMHATTEAPTDSMRMFQWGLEGGRPAEGSIGVAPEWFYKGCGTTLRAHGEPLLVPAFAEDGGEEAEIVGVYTIDPDGAPRRIGMAAGNEFSDHRLEKRNYLYLAHSKLRDCAIGPELVVDPDFQAVPGEVAIVRNGQVIWSMQIQSGDAHMSHSLANMEHHHFKYEAHRRPGDVHVHFFGAAALSFGHGITLADGDVMRIQFAGFGRALRNPVRIDRTAERRATVRPL